MHRRMTSAVALLMLAAITLTGCTSEASNIGVAKNKENNVVDTGFSVSTVGSYDSADTAVVLSIDTSNKAVSLINMETGKQYTLYYDGTTYVKDKYEGAMTISQIKEGDIVDVMFLKGKKKLASIQKSPKAWVYDSISNYDLAGANKTASIGSKTYSLPAGVVVLSEGRRMGTEEVVSQDEVTISGIDHKIYSVKVDKGHGYLRLKNDQPVLGGWIEVGNRVICQITEDMLLTVPEGSYQVVLDNHGVGCIKEITVERGKEVLLDVGDVEIAEDKTGIILFEVTPASAKISVDGKPVEAGTAVELRYGIHQVVVEANGYDTLTKYIQVGSERAAISFTLEETRKSNSNDRTVSGNNAERIPWQDTFDSADRNSISKNDLSSLSQNALTTTNNNKVYVDSPKGVEVFLDGNYVGVAPVRFTKSPGRHEITLKKTGYKTKSYTIYLENNSRDETYSFSDLEKEGSSNNGGNNGDKNPSSSGGTTGGPPPEAPGEVTFSITPNDAIVSVDGTQVDISKAVELSCGSHTVCIEKEGYETIEKTIQVASGEQTKPFDLRRIIEVSFHISPSDATLTIDGSNSTYSGEERTIKLVCGSHKIEVKADGFETYAKDFEVKEHMEPVRITLVSKESEDDKKDDDKGGAEDGDKGETEGGDVNLSGPTTGTPPLPEDQLTTEKTEISQESHPIRNFFSSLFKR